MSRNQMPIILSISKKRYETQISSSIERVATEKQSQTIVTRTFNARRNSGQIERYFIESHTTCCISFLIIILSLILFATVILLLIFPRIIIRDKISDMTEEIVLLTQEEIITLVSSDLNLSYFYSELITRLMTKPGMIPIDQYSTYSATSMAKMFAKAYRTNENNKVWRFGASNGFFIGFDTENGIKLYIARTNENNIYPLYSWIGDPVTYFNNSYPAVFFDQGDPYVSNFEYWYLQAEQERKTSWTPLNTGFGPRGNLVPIISTSSPIFDPDTKEIINVISIGVHLEQTQLFFDYFLKSPNSRFALLNSPDTEGTILACTSQDLSYEEVNSMLSFKTLLELNDDFWRKIVSTEEFGENQNFEFEYNSEVIHCVHISFQMAPEVNWCFFSAFTISDVVNVDIKTVDTWTLIFCFVFCIVYIILMVLIVVFQNLVSFQKSKILKKKEKKSSDSHIKYIGITPSIKLLQRLLLSHGDDSYINRNVDGIINDLLLSPRIPYFDSEILFKEIENQKVKDKFLDIFGLPESAALKVLHKPSKDSLEIVESYQEKRSSRNQALSRVIKDNSFAKKFEKIQISRHNIVNFKRDKIMKKVSYFVQSLNLLNPLFDPDQLDIVLQKIMLRIGDQTLPLLYDSIEFVFIIMKRNGEQLILDSDYSLSLIFAIFSFHLSMVNRTNQELMFFDKFFQRHLAPISQDCHSILFGLYKILVGTDVEYMKRWEKFKDLTFYLITKSVELYEHRISFEKCQIVIKMFYDCQMKLTVAQANSVVLFLFCGSQFSFYFHSRDDCHTLLNIFIPIDVKPAPKLLSKFINCLIAQYLMPLTNALSTLCGSDYIDWMRHVVDSNSPPPNSKIVK